MVSALEWLLDTAASREAIDILGRAKFALIQERRNLGVALLDELDKQKYGKRL